MDWKLGEIPAQLVKHSKKGKERVDKGKEGALNEKKEDPAWLGGNVESEMKE